MSDETNVYANAALPSAPLTPGEEKQWAILTHVLSIFFGAVAAIAFFVIYRNRGPFVRAHTATEFNFQLTVLIVTGLGFVFSFGSVFGSIIVSSGGGANSGVSGMPPGFGLFFVGYFLILAVRIIAVILGIFAALAANKGKYYRYPLAIPFAK